MLVAEEPWPEDAMSSLHHDRKLLLNSPHSSLHLFFFLMLLLGFSSLLCYFTILFLDLFLNPLLTDVLRSSRTWVYSCCSTTPWFSVSFEEFPSCICFFLVEITPLFWTVWMWSPTHSVLLGVQGPSVGSVWSPTCHKASPRPVCTAVGEAR